MAPGDRTTRFAIFGGTREGRDVTMPRDNDANQRRKGMIKQTITLALNLIPDRNWHLIFWQFPAPFVTVSPLPRLYVEGHWKDSWQIIITVVFLVLSGYIKVLSLQTTLSAILNA